MRECSAYKALAAGPAQFESRRIPLRGLAPPAAGEVHAWYLHLGQLGQSLRGALDGHHDTHSGPAFTVGQLRFARRFFLRLLLGAYLGLPGKSVHIRRSGRGKPVLDADSHGGNLHFSMAKSRDRLLVGFSASDPLGVDLEPAGRRAHDPLGVARRYFSPTEADALASMSPAARDAAFLRTWACKEAVVKSSGEGIANQLCRFTVQTDLAHPPEVLEFEGDSPRDWSLALLAPEDGLLGAVAVRRPNVPVRCLRLLPAGDTGRLKSAT
ncbi:MAG: 4'-phosphopantetheinyl transferase superfamily protein [Gammaproteobacteria bacterium]|nr:4'-phosphopantetheinyl transferase superfamily protein [Gammaproteobacteria bacterium]